MRDVHFEYTFCSELRGGRTLGGRWPEFVSSNWGSIPDARLEACVSILPPPCRGQFGRLRLSLSLSVSCDRGVFGRRRPPHYVRTPLFYCFCYDFRPQVAICPVEVKALLSPAGIGQTQTRCASKPRGSRPHRRLLVRGIAEKARVAEKGRSNVA